MSEKPSVPAGKRERTFVYSLARFITVIYADVFRKVRFSGRERLHALEGPAILAANHRSMLDPLLLGICSPFEIRFLGKRELASGKVGAFVFEHLHMIPVSRHETDIAAMRACLKALKDGDILGVFPEGTRCKNTLLEHMESGAALIALRSGAPILPAYIDSGHRFFRRTRVVIGTPVEYDDLKSERISSETADKLTERIREAIFRLKDECEKERLRA